MPLFGGGGKRNHTPANPTEAQAIIIEKLLHRPKIIDYTQLESVKPDDLSDRANIVRKFQSFRHWLKDVYGPSPHVRLYGINSYRGLGKRWAVIHVGSLEDAFILHRGLSERRNAGRYQKELSVCYLHETPTQPTSGPSLVFSPAAETGTAAVKLGSLCGQLAEFRSIADAGTQDAPVIATIGGIVARNGRLWVVTARHASPPPHSQRVPQPEGDSKIDPSEYDVDKIEPLYAIKPRQRGGTPTGATPIRFDFAQEISTNLEYLLVSLDNPTLMLPNLFRPKFGGPCKSLRKIEPRPRAGTVTVLAGASGCHLMRMLDEEVNFRLPSGRWKTVWVLEPCTAKDFVMVQPGDSGSWVVDPDRGSVFGIVIASTSFMVYLMPLRDVLEHALGQDREGCWSLPNAEEVAAIKEASLKRQELESLKEAALEAIARAEANRSRLGRIIPSKTASGLSSMQSRRRRRTGTRPLPGPMPSTSSQELTAVDEDDPLLTLEPPPVRPSLGRGINPPDPVTPLMMPNCKFSAFFWGGGRGEGVTGGTKRVGPVSMLMVFLTDYPSKSGSGAWEAHPAGSRNLNTVPGLATSCRAASPSPPNRVLRGSKISTHKAPKPSKI